MNGRMSAGHPVDIASGTLWNEVTDFSLPGTYPMAWERRYATDLLSAPAGPFGPGWTCPYFAALTRIGKDWHFRGPDGGVLILPDPDDKAEHGGIIRIAGAFTELSQRGLTCRVTRWNPEHFRLTHYVFTRDRNGTFWPLRSLENETGMALDLAWDAKGLLKGVRQRLEKRTLLISHDANGLLASVSFRHQDGRQQMLARYEYDAKGRLAAAFDSAGLADRYEYLPDGKMNREIAKDGAVFSFRYDDQGRCIRTSGLDGYDLKILRYLDHIGWTEVVDSRGNTSRYQKLPSGQIQAVIDPKGGRTETEYDAEGRIVKITDPLGNATEFGYDADGNRCRMKDAAGGETILEFGPGHLPVQATDSLGETWKRTYDPAGRLIALEGPAGEKWEAVFDADGLLRKVRAPNGAERGFAYSPDGVPTAQTDWLGNVTRFKIDAFGRTVAKEDALGQAQTVQYDLAGNVLAVIRPDGAAFKFAYDSAGNVTSMTDENGAVTGYRYGTCRRLLEAIDPDGKRRRYRWSTEPNQLLEVINENGEVHSFQYDANGYVSATKGFDGGLTRYRYDGAGRCTAIVWPSGKTTRFAWNPTGKLLERIGTDGTASVFGYDAMGRMISAENPSASVKLERDILGRIVAEKQAAGTVRTLFDALDNPLLTESDTGYRVVREFDANGQLSAFEAAAGGRVEINRNPLGWEIGRRMPGGLDLEQAWDARGNLRAQNLTCAGASVVRREYAYDAVGNLAQAEDGRWGVSRYIHDPADRLIRVLRREGKNETFRFDAAGNLTETGTGAEPPVPMDYGPGNRLLRRGDTRYGYDADGRLIWKTLGGDGPDARIWRYAWDGDGNLSSITNPDGGVWRYAYDAFGRRISKEGPDVSRRFLWSRNNLIQELESKVPKADWIYETESFQVLAKIADGRAWWAVNDQIGAARELVDERGEVAWAGEYAAWGRAGAAGPDAAECPVRFQGQWEDPETGLHYNGFRYYDPETGRYISPDPMGLEAGLNGYAYAPSPLNWIDPLGLKCTKQQQEQLKKDAKELHAMFKEGDEQNRRTVAVAILTDPKTGKQTKVVAVSSDRFSSTVRAEAEARGYTVVRMKEGGSTHAEQIIMDHAQANGLHSTIAPNRPACGPERADCRGRADRSRNHTILDPD